MQFIGELFVAFFSIYLAATSVLADSIESLLPGHEETSISLQRIGSTYESIPNILIENASYQVGNTIESNQSTLAPATPTEALVNIYCTYTTDEYTRTTTGTGFFIDEDGIVLTNAHVAQFLLLETIEGATDCILRTGDPAVPTYEVDLLYISPAWIQKHAELIDATQPRGTGERDYALLYVTAGLNTKPMPRHFPTLRIDTQLLPIQAIGESVTAAGYPAETLLKSDGAEAQLYPREVTTDIAELMTFGSNYADLMTISGSAIGEQGSSGGPVLNKNGDVIGLISTRGDDHLYGEGSLRALTLSYVDRTMQEETGFTLERYLGGNLPYRSQLFKETLGPFLKRMLERELRN